MRGQVTIYVILGIVILAIVIFAFAYSGALSKLGILKSTTQVVPTQVRPVQDYIDSCVETTLQEGVDLIGLQGGYIDIPQDVLPRSVINPFSNRLEILDGYEVPYWFYEKSNGIQEEQVPTMQEMEISLAQYVDDNLPGCLTNLSAFNEFTIDINGDVSSKAKISDERIDVSVTYPILFSTQDINTQLKNYQASYAVPFGKLYGMGKKILEKENADYFLEKITEDSLVVYDELPYHGESFDCTPKTWLKQDVEKQLKEIINMNTNPLTIENTARSADPYFTIPLETLNYRDIQADFIYYPSWPFELKIDGGAEVLTEQSSTGSAGLLMNLFCINTRQFIYDIKYPVLIRLEDSQGFTFQFATQSIIDNNQPRVNRLGLDDYGSTEKVICNSADMPITVLPIDSLTGEILRGAQVSFICTGTLCEVGTTSEEGLTADFPQCMNGVLNVEKEGYAKGEIITDTLESAEVSVLLKPEFTKRLLIQVIDQGYPRSLLNDESVIIQFSNEQDKYAKTVTEENKDISLVDGTYDIKGYITKKRDITFPKKDVEYCVDVPRTGILGVLGSMQKKCSTTTIESTTLDSVLIGGAEFSYSFEDLSLGNTLTVYLPIERTPVSVDDLQKVYGRVATNSERSDFKTPEIA